MAKKPNGKVRVRIIQLAQILRPPPTLGRGDGPPLAVPSIRKPMSMQFRCQWFVQQLTDQAQEKER